jgi:alkaline phosphatase D
VPISRRTFLLGGASALAVAACSGNDDDSSAPATTTTSEVTVPTTRPPAVRLAADPFTLGVASGDPDPGSVVLWTRLMGAEGEHEVVWTVTDERDVLVAAGVAMAVPDDAHSVRVVVDGLEPDTWYRYRFAAGEFESPAGRARTTPAEGGERLRFAFASCQDWQDGHYAAHEHLAAEDVDLVVFLGDYIYESGISESAVRPHDGPEVTTLDAYRARYALYRSDPNLQAAHARAPWFVVWDDHEVDNNHAGATPEIGAPDVDFAARRAAAYKAWWEHMPTRLARPEGDALEIHRALRWGSLAAFFGLDGRQHRDDQPCGADGDLGAGCPERDDPARTMLGAEQEAWLAAELPASASTWNVLAQQTIVSPSGIPVGPTELFNLDQWDGYPAARERLLDVLAATANPVIITGDIHASAVADVRRDDEVVAVELVGTSLSSSFPDALVELFEAAAENAGAKMADARHRGYVLCELTADTFRADYRVVDSVLEPSSPISTSSSWQIDAGTPGVRPLA